MRPVTLAHSRPIKKIKFNFEGDLLFSGSSDKMIALWSTETFERIGTYTHLSAVADMEITKDSKYLISTDTVGQVYVWETLTGELITKFENDKIDFNITCLDLSSNDSSIAIARSSRQNKETGGIEIYSVKDLFSFKKSSKYDSLKGVLVNRVECPLGDKYIHSLFTNLNKELYCSSFMGNVYHLDINTGSILNQNKIHDGIITDFDISPKHEVLLTCSKDKKACIIDPTSLDIFQEIRPTKPIRNINTGKISPLISLSDEEKIRNHIFISGGQDSKDVTNTQSKEGGFELLIYHAVYGNELGSLTSHFGTVNTMDISNDGMMLATGGEDSGVIVYRFETDYLSLDK